MIKPGVLRVKTMKSISNLQVTCITQFSLTVVFIFCFFCFFLLLLLPFFYLLFPFWIVDRNKIMFSKLLRKMLRGTNQKIYDYCTCSRSSSRKKLNSETGKKYGIQIGIWALSNLKVGHYISRKSLCVFHANSKNRGCFSRIISYEV